MLQGCHSARVQQAVSLGSRGDGGGQEQEWLTVVQAAVPSVKSAMNEQGQPCVVNAFH